VLVLVLERFVAALIEPLLAKSSTGFLQGRSLINPVLGDR
jgi:hypothetical protein